MPEKAQPKKAAAKKTAAKKTATKTAAVKKTAVKKTAVKKTAAKKTAAVKKAAAKKTPAKKAAVKKTAVKKTAKKTAKTAAKAPKKGAVVVQDPTFEIVRKCWQALDDKKAENLKVLDVRGKSPITNYFIIATATSEPHLRALANELDKTLKDLGVKSIGRESNPGSGWVVVDAFDFMAHLFLPEQRGMYGIEALWKDAEELM